MATHFIALIPAMTNEKLNSYELKQCFSTQLVVSVDIFLACHKYVFEKYVYFEEHKLSMGWQYFSRVDFLCQQLKLKFAIFIPNNRFIFAELSHLNYLIGQWVHIAVEFLCNNPKKVECVISEMSIWFENTQKCSWK